MPKDAVVIGGGLAGLTAAVALTDAGWRVTVIERRSMLGGRARSFPDPASGDLVDNGQHVFVGCYDATLRFFKRLRTDHGITFQDRLEVTYAEAGREKFGRLKALNLPAPWHLAGGLLGFSYLSLWDKLAMVKVPQAARAALQGDSQLLDQMTVSGWLQQLGQSQRARHVFWDPLAIATLNDDPNRASALGFATVLDKMFSSEPQACRLGLANVGLSDLYTDQSTRVIEDGGGTVKLNTSVAGLEIEDERLGGVRLASGELIRADAVVSSVTPQELLRLVPEDFRQGEATWERIGQFRSSGILSIHLWLDREVLTEPFVGLIGTWAQWLFNRPRLVTGGTTRHVALVVSAATDDLQLTNAQLVTKALKDLSQTISAIREATVLRSQVIREPHATVSTPAGSAAWRPGPQAGWNNFILAGDWTDTGLPATMESAVLSGYRAAEKVLAVARPGR